MLPVAHPVHDFGELLALLVGERAPEPGETLVPQLGIRLDVAGQGFGERAHIAGALHVVLPAQGDEPGGRPPDHAAEHDEVRQRAAGSGSRYLLGDAHAVEDDGIGPLGVQPGRFPDGFGLEAGERRGPFRSAALQRGAQCVEMLRALVDEGVDPALFLQTE